MRRSLSILIAVTMVFVSFAPSLLQAGSKEVAKVETATEVLKQIMAIPEQSIPPSLLRNAQGVAVIPGVIKVGFIVGGRGGRGILVVRKRENRWSNPSFVTIAGGSVGWQIGAQSADVILVFKSRKGVDGIVKGKFTLGADAAVAAGPVGRQAEAATDIQMKAEIYSYSRSRGLFAGIALEGAALQIDDKSNKAFYGTEDITASDVFADKGIGVPVAANEFKKVLKKYTSMEK